MRSSIHDSSPCLKLEKGETGLRILSIALNTAWGSRFVLPVPLVLLAVAFLLPFGCKKTPAEPPFRSPREYTWDVQEVSSPGFQVSANGIWGSSSEDIYVTFQSGSVRNFKLFHFDGAQWSQVDVSQFGSSQVGFNLYAIAGFSSSDVWAVGAQTYTNPAPPPNLLDSALVIHFDGSTWSEVALPNRRLGLRAIGGVSPSDVWFGGRGSAIYHFDGNHINIDTLPSVFPTVNSGLICDQIVVGPLNKRYAVFNDGSTGYFHFLGDSGSSWRELDSQFAWQSSVWVSPTGKIFSTFFSHGVYTWPGVAPWALFYDNPSASIFVRGVSEEDLFVTGQNQCLYHYNGTEWYKVPGFDSTNVTFLDIWECGEEVFVVGTDGTKSFIFHGR